MGMLATIRDFVLFRDLPANQPARTAAPIEQRSLSGIVPGWKTGRPTWFDDGNVLVMTREGYRKCVTAFACINIIADAVAEATLRVWEDQGPGQRDELPDHPLRALMQRPNPGKSESEFLSLMVRIAAITGFCVAEKIRSARGNVVELGILDMRYLRPVLRDQRQPDWEYAVPGHPVAILPAEDAIVFTYMDSPFVDQVTGDTPLRAVLRQAGILHELTDFVKLLLERGGIPQIVLVVEHDNPDEGPIERLTEEEIEYTREQFRQKYAGYRNWAGPAVIDGMRVEKVGMNLNDLAFTDLRDGLDLDVCRSFRVPPPLVQVMAGLSTSYGKTLEESMTVLQQYTANPLRARLDGALTRQLLPEFDSRPNISLEFDTSAVDSLQEDEDAVHTRAREDLRAGGMQLDEFRQAVGLEPLATDLGRSLLLPFSVIPTLADTPLTLPTPTETPPNPQGDPDEDPDSDAARARRAAQPTFLVRQGRRYVNRRALHPVEVQRRAVAADLSRLNQARLAGVLGPQVAGFFRAQRDRVLEAIAGERSGLAVERRYAEAVDWLFEDEELGRLFRKWLMQVGEVAAQTASQQLGAEIAWDVANPSIRNLMDDLAGRVKGINATTRADIEAVVRDGLLKGTTMDDLAKDLEGLFDETYKNRHLTVARTESQVAYNVSTERAYIESGVVDSVQLYDNPLHTTDPGSDGLTCSERDGLIVPLGQSRRHVEGEHPNGTLAMAGVLSKPLGEV